MEYTKANLHQFIFDTPKFDELKYNDQLKFIKLYATLYIKDTVKDVINRVGSEYTLETMKRIYVGFMETKKTAEDRNMELLAQIRSASIYSLQDIQNKITHNQKVCNVYKVMTDMLYKECFVK